MAVSFDLAGRDHTHERENCSMKYHEVPETSEVFSRALNHYNWLKKQHFRNTPEFLCLGKTVVFQIIDTNGNVIITDNRVTQPTTYCVKHVDDLDNYAPCAEVCGQVCHSEISGILEYFLRCGMLTQQEIDSLKNEHFRIKRNDPSGMRFIGRRISHAALKDLIRRKNLRVKEGTSAYMYGHDKCCPQCAEILEMINLTSIGITPSSLAFQRNERESYHNGIYAQSYINEGNPHLPLRAFPQSELES